MVDVFHIRVIRLDGNTDMFVYMFVDFSLYACSIYEDRNQCWI
jgi:hypothetical protein